MLRFDCSPTISQYQRPAMSLCPSVSSVCFCCFFSPYFRLCVPTCPSVRLSVSRSFVSSVCLSLYPPPLSLFACLPACLPVYLSIRFLRLPLSFSIPVSVCLPACLPACLSVCLSVCLSICYESKECNRRSTSRKIDKH